MSSIENNLDINNEVNLSKKVPTEMALNIWRSFHWSFFINVQALIISLERLNYFLELQDVESAEKELLASAELLEASAAAMNLASSFSHASYIENVRDTMMPPAVESDNFSGLMSWEHSTLMVSWRKMRSHFNNLPPSLDYAHEKFVLAYRVMAENHTKVCAKFGGDVDGSIRFGERSGVESLKRFARNRSALIDPKQKVKGCPFNINEGEP